MPPSSGPFELHDSCDDALHGLHEWQGVPRIVRMTFRALSEALRAQSEAIKSLERNLHQSTNATERQQRMNHADLLSTLEELSRVVDQKEEAAASAAAGSQQEVERLAERCAANERAVEVRIDELRDTVVEAIGSKADRSDIEAGAAAARRHAEGIVEKLCATQLQLQATLEHERAEREALAHRLEAVLGELGFDPAIGPSDDAGGGEAPTPARCQGVAAVDAAAAAAAAAASLGSCASPASASAFASASVSASASASASLRMVSPPMRRDDSGGGGGGGGGGSIVVVGGGGVGAPLGLGALRSAVAALQRDAAAAAERIDEMSAAAAAREEAARGEAAAAREVWQAAEAKGREATREAHAEAARAVEEMGATLRADCAAHVTEQRQQQRRQQQAAATALEQMRRDAAQQTQAAVEAAEQRAAEAAAGAAAGAAREAATKQVARQRAEAAKEVAALEGRLREVAAEQAAERARLRTALASKAEAADHRRVATELGELAARVDGKATIAEVQGALAAKAEASVLRRLTSGVEGVVEAVEGKADAVQLAQLRSDVATTLEAARGTAAAAAASLDELRFALDACRAEVRAQRAEVHAQRDEAAQLRAALSHKAETATRIYVGGGGGLKHGPQPSSPRGSPAACRGVGSAAGYRSR